MILRRLTEHVKDQNWFAVGIDFFIVVIGVFFGLQVSNWNDVQQARGDENRLVNQLLIDVNEAVVAKGEWVSTTQAHVDQLIAAIDVIQNQPNRTELDHTQCNAAWSSHLLRWPGTQLGTLDEMVSSGGLGVIRSDQLRRQLLRFQAGRVTIDRYFNHTISDIVTVVDRHPDAFIRGFDIADDLLTVYCDLDAMRKNRGLQNHLLSNLGRTRGAISMAKYEIGLLETLKTEIGEPAR